MLALVLFHLHNCLSKKGRADQTFPHTVQLLLTDSPFVTPLKGYERVTVICPISVQGELQHGSLLLPAAHIK